MMVELFSSNEEGTATSQQVVLNQLTALEHVQPQGPQAWIGKRTRQANQKRFQLEVPNCFLFLWTNTQTNFPRQRNQPGLQLWFRWTKVVGIWVPWQVPWQPNWLGCLVSWIMYQLRAWFGLGALRSVSCPGAPSHNAGVCQHIFFYCCSHGRASHRNGCQSALAHHNHMYNWIFGWWGFRYALVCHSMEGGCVLGENWSGLWASASQDKAPSPGPGTLAVCQFSNQGLEILQHLIHWLCLPPL